MINLGLKEKMFKVDNGNVIIVFANDLNDTVKLFENKITEETKIYVICKTIKDMIEIPVLLSKIDNITKSNEDINLVTVIPVIMYVPLNDEYVDIVDTLDVNGWYADVTVDKFIFINKEPLHLSESVSIYMNFTNSKPGIYVNYGEDFTEINAICSTDIVANIKLTVTICE